jgi:hypothetical protein
LVTTGLSRCSLGIFKKYIASEEAKNYFLAAFFAGAFFLVDFFAGAAFFAAFLAAAISKLLIRASIVNSSFLLGAQLRESVDPSSSELQVLHRE